VIVVDTNILVYAADVDSPHHLASRDWLTNRRARPDAWYLTWGIVYEFLRITTHPKVMRQPWNSVASWGFIKALIASSSLTFLAPTQRHAEVAEKVIEELPEMRGNLLHDMHTAILMREHGIRQICTRDADFYRFPFIEVIDLLRV
jgi:uncharacterized protein